MFFFFPSSLFLRNAAASIALIDQPNLTAEEIVRKSMKIAGDICVYTNHNLIVETIQPPAAGAAIAGAAASTVTPAATTETAASSVWAHQDNKEAPKTPINENIPSSDT